MRGILVQSLVSRGIPFEVALETATQVRDQVGERGEIHVGELTNAEAESRRVNNQPAPVLAVPTVPSVNYFDLALGWDFGENASLNLGIENLFDEDPPLLGSAARDANTDPTTYDILGRRYFLRVRLSY